MINPLNLGGSRMPPQNLNTNCICTWVIKLSKPYTAKSKLVIIIAKDFLRNNNATASGYIGSADVCPKSAISKFSFMEKATEGA